MNEAKAQQLIVLASAVTIGSTVSGMIVAPKSIQEKHKQEEKEVREHRRKTSQVANTHRAIVGGFFAMAGCSVIAMFAPDAGVGIAALVAGGAFVVYGLPTISNYFTPEEGKKK